MGLRLRDGHGHISGWSTRQILVSSAFSPVVILSSFFQCICFQCCTSVHWVSKLKCSVAFHNGLCRSAAPIWRTAPGRPAADPFGSQNAINGTRRCRLLKLTELGDSPQEFVRGATITSTGGWQDREIRAVRNRAGAVTTPFSER